MIVMNISNVYKIVAENAIPVASTFGGVTTVTPVTAPYTVAKWIDPTSVTYSFALNNYEAYANDPDYSFLFESGVTSFDPVQIAAAEYVLNSIERVAAIDLDQSPIGIAPNINFSNYSYTPLPLMKPYYGIGLNPSDYNFYHQVAGDVWFNTGNLNPNFFLDGSNELWTLLHETLHAVGLSHVEGDSPDITVAHSVMSYKSHPSMPKINPSSLMPYDIAALQRLYSANLQPSPHDESGTHNNIYLFNGEFHNKLVTYYDSYGHDTYDASERDDNVHFDLRFGQYSSVGTFDDTFAFVPIRKAASQNVANILRPEGYDDDAVKTFLIEDAKTGTGNDTVVGNEVNNLLQSGAGADSIHGGDGADTLLGGEGNDTLSGGADNDQIGGDADADLICGESGADTLQGDSGNDTLDGGADNDLIDGNDGQDNIFGGPGADTLRAGPGPDQINGEDGNDTLSGDAGGDQIDGGTGYNCADYTAAANGILIEVVGATHFYEIVAYNDGFGFSDTLRNIQKINGSAHNDMFVFSHGFVEIHGGGGIDTLDLSGPLMQHATVSINGETVTIAANGQMITAHGIEIVRASDGNDSILGAAGNDRLYGGNGHDTIQGDAGLDEIHGGTGDDLIYTYKDGADPNLDTLNDNAWGNEGSDLIIGNGGRNWIYGGADADTIYGWAHDDRLAGEDGEDLIYGGVGADIINGGAFNDTLHGGDGDDNLDGGDGDDLIYGQEGFDAIIGGDGQDTLSYEYLATGQTFSFTRSSGGILNVSTSIGDVDRTSSIEAIYATSFSDTVIATPHKSLDGGTWLTPALYGGNGTDLVDFSAFAFPLYIDLGGAYGNSEIIQGPGIGKALVGFENAIGTAYNDHMVAAKSGSQLDAGAGADFLNGGAGHDTLNAGDGNDYMVGGAGNDILEAGGGDNHAFGDAGDDALNGGSGADYLCGGAGLDTLDGGEGNDTIYADSDNLADTSTFGLLNDNAWGRGGNDRIHGNHGRNWLHGNNGDDTIHAYGHDDRLYGGDGNDQLLGGDGNDRIHGEEGADALKGDAGNDLITGDAGNDTLRGGPGSDTLMGGDGDDLILGLESSSVSMFEFKDLYGGTGVDDFAISHDFFHTHVGGNVVVNICDFEAGERIHIGAPLASSVETSPGVLRFDVKPTYLEYGYCGMTLYYGPSGGTIIADNGNRVNIFGSSLDGYSVVHDGVW